MLNSTQVKDTEENHFLFNVGNTHSCTFFAELF